MVPEQAFENGAQVGGGFKVPLLVQISFLEARPICDDAPTFERTADQQCYCAGAVIRALGAVNAGGAASRAGRPEAGEELK
jgi:hypothetical protein